MASNGCPCGCDRRVELAKEQRKAVDPQAVCDLARGCHELDYANRKIEPEVGWRLNDILGAPMRAGVIYSADPDDEPILLRTQGEFVTFDIDADHTIVRVIGIDTSLSEVLKCERHPSGDMHWCTTHDAMWAEGMSWCEGA